MMKMDIYKIMAEIEEGKEYMLIHNRLEEYIKEYAQHQ